MTSAIVFAYSNVGDRCLRLLHAAGVDIPLVVTHRDAPGESRWFESVAETARELYLPCRLSHGPVTADLAATISAASPDLIFSFYFRDLLPQALLRSARLGAYNLHGSLLPRFRGRAPTNWAVLTGATETGATLHEMVEAPDAGAIVDQVAVPILPDDTGRQVFDKVTVAAEQVLWRSLPGLLAGTAPRRTNDLAAGSYFGRRRPEDGRIDWQCPAKTVYDLVRAVAPPYPGAFTEIRGLRLVVARARCKAARPLPTGSALGLHLIGDRILGLCGDGGAVAIDELRFDDVPVRLETLINLLAADRIHP